MTMNAAAPPADRFDIAGRTVELPVRIRHARQWSASWLVPAAAAQAVIDYSGLEVAQPLPGRAMVALAFVDYLDGDLDVYHEVAISVVVRRHDAPTGATTRDHFRDMRNGDIAAFIHDLPVDQAFTCEAGNVIWGYPKWIADIDITPMKGRTACTLRSEAGVQFTLDIADGGPLPMPKTMPPTYSWRDGVLRRTEWEVTTTGGGARLGGGRLTIGNHGPVAETLRRLRLSGRSIMSSATPHLTSTFGPGEIVREG